MKFLLIFFFLLITASLQANVQQIVSASSGSGAPPTSRELFIPYGSYLEGSHYSRDLNLNREHACDPGSVSYNPETGSISAACGITRSGPLTLQNAYECWFNGHDITFGSVPSSPGSIFLETTLVCDTSVKRTPVNLARFLVSNWVPDGGYLRTCMGQIYDKNNRRLYTTCLKNLWSKKKKRSNLIGYLMY